MRMFDRIDAAGLEHRDWQLWMLAMVSIFILTAGMALLMYPTVFSTSEGPGGVIFRRSFVGFCILCFLLEVYLLDRHLVIRRLRKQLADEQQLKVRIVQQASTDLLGSLPGFSHFQDRLAMEFRRAASTQQPLSLLLVVLRLAREVAGPETAAAAQGDAAKALIRKLRGQDSIFLFQPGVFAVVLPGVRGADAQRVADRLREGLVDVAGVSSRFAAEIQVANYPEHTSTAREMEQIAARCFSKDKAVASAA